MPATFPASLLFFLVVWQPFLLNSEASFVGRSQTISSALRKGKISVAQNLLKKKLIAKRGIVEGHRGLHECHLLRFRCHSSLDIHVPHHGHLRASDQATRTRRPIFNDDRVLFETNHTHAQMQSVGKLCSPKSGHAPHPHLSVLMPGQRYPTFLAQPAPLLSCPREGIYLPSHDHHALFVHSLAMQ
ncbi:hypothetical protein HPP92_011432 [Vanilla planifolia]|uniref:Secreted protein n=1 Tax=Vanilla planifolia TaxID=51239 RepID=A0A835QXK4_VANPL|nr:hypothetical protein HPP92_011432 [Vanilla planifolia]